MRPAALLLVLLAGCSSIRLDGPLGSPASGAPALPLERAWERDAQGAFGRAAPHLTDRYVVVGTRRGEVVVIDREDGGTVAVGEFGDSVEGPVAVSADGAVVFVATAEHDGGVEAFDVRAGRRVWRWEGGALEAGVVRLGDVLVTASLDGWTTALDADTGALRWSLRTDTTSQIHATPLVLDAGVVVADHVGRVRRLDVRTGAEVWRVNVGQPVYETPALGPEAVYVATTRGLLVALDRESGAVQWSYDAGGPLRLSTPAVGGSTIAVGLTDGRVVALDRETGAERWTYRADGNVSAAPLWIGPTLLVGTYDERVVALDGATGREVWADALRGRVKSAMAAASDLVVVLTEPRHVVAYRPAGFAAR